jgi:hypothetical protein
MPDTEIMIEKVSGIFLLAHNIFNQSGWWGDLNG